MSESFPSNPTASTLIARASNTVRNKNLILIAMFLFATTWFAFDGFHRYPRNNDAAVNHMLGKIPTDPDPTHWDRDAVDPKHQPMLRAWPGWNNASHDQKTALYELAKEKTLEGFHSELDIQNQQLITYALILATLATVWWFFHCQRRRVIADEASLSPSPGITIPWDQIKIVDNTVWKKKGYVYITYTDPAGAERQATLDDYIVDRAPLIEILNRVELRAPHAEFLPKTPPGGGLTQEGDDPQA